MRKVTVKNLVSKLLKIPRHKVTKRGVLLPPQVHHYISKTILDQGKLRRK